MMLKPKIVLTESFHPKSINKLLKPQATVCLANTKKDLKSQLKDADALICLLKDKINSELLENAKNLKVIGTYAVGVDHIDLHYCQNKTISVVNTPDVLTRSTAELALGLVLACARRFTEGARLCTSGNFRGWKPDLLLGQQLLGRQCVLVGKGRIGLESAKLFRAIGMKTSFITRKDSPSQIKLKLQTAEVLSLHLPGPSPERPENRHWLNAQRMKLLPNHAIVINTARGNVIDEHALIENLRTKRIFSAGLDVFENEPKIPLALRKLPNVVLMPHIGSATHTARTQMAEILIKGVLKVLRGQRPKNLVKMKSCPE